MLSLMGPKKAKSSKPRIRNRVLGGGIMRFSRSAMAGRKAIYKFAKPGQNKAEKPEPKPKMIEKKIGGEKNGGTRMVPAKRYRKSYETQELPRKLPTRQKRFRDHKRKLRASITPGTVLIQLAGVHKGKRVVFLKQLGTGMLLVTGPYVINGCPMRRINQRYVIATKTKIDISSVKLPERVNDTYFKRQKVKRARPAEGEIFNKEKAKYVVSAERKEDQIAVDKALIAAIKKREDKRLMFGYLKKKFFLSNKDYPHKMIF